jgi:hypothetical protein
MWSLPHSEKESHCRPDRSGKDVRGTEVVEGETYRVLILLKCDSAYPRLRDAPRHCLVHSEQQAGDLIFDDGALAGFAGTSRSLPSVQAGAA